MKLTSDIYSKCPKYLLFFLFICSLVKATLQLVEQYLFFYSVLTDIAETYQFL